jgi:DNA-binding NarL/FixJ family response regulator
MEKTRIVLADDHKLFRDGVTALLHKYDEFEVIGEAENGKQLFPILKNEDPDVVLVDLSMPELNGLEAIPMIKKDFPDVKMVVLSMHEDGNYIMKSVQAGAQGYLFKNVDEDELINAIRKVARGEKYFNPMVSQKMIDSMSKQTQDGEAHLTAREKEILKLVCDGLSTKMIADKLFLSTRTVETHRVNIMKKLNAQNTADLVKKAFEQNLLA